MLYRLAESVAPREAFLPSALYDLQSQACVSDKLLKKEAKLTLVGRNGLYESIRSVVSLVLNPHWCESVMKSG
jgi:hypothetical protein